MKINRLVIENFKSIERIELIEPNPFTVFVGPNGSGKSNIFEALEFVSLQEMFGGITSSFFGGPESFLRKQNQANRFLVEYDSTISFFERGYHREIIQSLSTESVGLETFGYISNNKPKSHSAEGDEIFANFSHLFIGNHKLQRLNLKDAIILTLSADNLEKVLKRILTNPVLRDEIFEWLELFVPGFKAVEVDDRDELHWFENSSSDYFTKDLISDGTYNILALLTAVYQSDDKPQFLCIEEPENGLHPQVLMSLVDFFRQQCEEKGHYVWLNTHSESLVRGLTTDEIILVNKVDGATKTRQIKGRNLYDLPTDEAWPTGALGGGLPW